MLPQFIVKMVNIFKFGGASVQNVEGVKRVAKILENYSQDNLVIVFSAMGKTTNMLEQVVQSYMEDSDTILLNLQKVKAFHYEIINALFEEKHSIFSEVENFFTEIEWVLESNSKSDYNYTYDQIVAVGELISSKIVSAYFSQIGIENTWLDARDIIHTDDKYRSAKILWEPTLKSCKEKITKYPIITQGFIGCTSENCTTTLGREGSDFTAAIIAYCLDANQVVIWKDVEGVRNADPRFFDNTIQLEKIPFAEAVELAYYGAKVIHPKTIQPLQKKSIPLLVKSFYAPDGKGSVIGNFDRIYPFVPSFIVKENQILISVSDKNLSFIVEEHLSAIFSVFSAIGISINMMQNSAVSFSFCVDNDYYKIPAAIEQLKMEFTLHYNEHLTLYTIRHYNSEAIEQVLKNKTLLLEQKTRNTVHLIVKAKN